MVNNDLYKKMTMKKLIVILSKLCIQKINGTRIKEILFLCQVHAVENQEKMGPTLLAYIGKIQSNP